MNYAVISLGGKQYIVHDGAKLKVDLLATEEGKSLTIDEVLLTAQDDTVSMGAPVVSGAKVEAKVLRHGKHDKITGVRMKAKKRLKKYFGHRQDFTEIEIVSVGGKKSKK